ncbi:hypothetical protein EVAR_33917_1 [Eumeta japonica]|uniref:Uncharacterized protein n=1 Tax=Eumeta variegata TaxID=151549 RepID=A0A4C1VYR8_EUMVA|nr:hypothetical protein EVAR_33917_1 [Eumeta japonica]
MPLRRRILPKSFYFGSRRLELEFYPLVQRGSEATVVRPTPRSDDVLVGTKRLSMYPYSLSSARSPAMLLKEGVRCVRTRPSSNICGRLVHHGFLTSMRIGNVNYMIRFLGVRRNPERVGIARGSRLGSIQTRCWFTRGTLYGPCDSSAGVVCPGRRARGDPSSLPGPAAARRSPPPSSLFLVFTLYIF